MLLLIFAIMGSIVAGLATPTEAAGVGVITTIVVGFVWGDLNWRKLGEALSASTRTFASIGFVIVGAVTLGQSISVLGLPRELLQDVSAAGLSQYQLLVVVILVYLFLGFFFEGLSLVLMTLPLIFPLMTGAGFDPVWTGVMITILVEVALITPPVGLNLFVLTAVTNQEVELSEAAMATVPYWVLLLLFIVLIAIFPDLVLYLPSLM